MLLKPRPTAELDRSGDQVYISVMAMVKQVVQLKNDVNMLPASEYPSAVKVGCLKKFVAQEEIFWGCTNLEEIPH